MVGKRRSIAYENRPKKIVDRKGGKQSSTASRKDQGSTRGKQTSILSFWGKHLAPKNTTVQKSDPKISQCPVQTEAINDAGRAIVVTPSSKVQPQKDVKSLDTKQGTKRDTSIAGVSQSDASVGTGMEPQMSEKVLAAITPSKNHTPPTKENESGDSKGGKAQADSISRMVETGTSTIAPRDRDDTDTSGSPPHGLSEYEKLRLRNIERNNARLAALGLLTAPAAGSNRSSNTNRGRPPRKKPKIHERTRQQPLRRSSRNRHPTTASGDAVNGSNLLDNPPTTKSEKIQEQRIEEETYTVYPLLQYEMSRNNTRNTGCVDKKGLTDLSMDAVLSSSSMCLELRGPRFLPPKGLTAIYSLEFWRGTDTESSLVSDRSNKRSNWLVGAGKAGMIALWDTNSRKDSNDSTVSISPNDNFVDPVLSWKAHSGRWIADAKFLPGSIRTTATSSTETPSRLITAGNDGAVCLWDLSTVSFSTGAPKLLHRTGKAYHNSGIFCMDTMSPALLNDAMICTGSKDKSVAVSSLKSLLAMGNTAEPTWRSEFHTAKVGAVNLQGLNSTVLASASDDGIVALHDYRTKGSTSESSLVAKLEDAHNRPHSVLWDPCNESIFVTAGLDPIVKVWDRRNISQPMACLQGHVPTSTARCKKIHRPVFFDPESRNTHPSNQKEPVVCPFLLTGGQGSSFVSIYQLESRNKDNVFYLSQSSSLISRGRLPMDCGDSGCIAVNGTQVAVAVDQGEILLLEPSRTQ